MALDAGTSITQDYMRVQLLLYIETIEKQRYLLVKTETRALKQPLTTSLAPV